MSLRGWKLRLASQTPLRFVCDQPGCAPWSGEGRTPHRVEARGRTARLLRTARRLHRSRSRVWRRDLGTSQQVHLLRDRLMHLGYACVSGGTHLRSEPSRASPSQVARSRCLCVLCFLLTLARRLHPSTPRKVLLLLRSGPHANATSLARPLPRLRGRSLGGLSEVGRTLHAGLRQEARLDDCS